MDLQLNVTMDTFKEFPNKIFIKRNFYCKKINTRVQTKNYSKNLSKYRNYFKDYFVDTGEVTAKTTEKYLEEIKKNKRKIMYLLYFKKKIIGQYGIHQWDNGYISLDGALRISAEGKNDIFSIIQKKILNLLKKKTRLNPPVIIVHKKNVSAIRLHKKFNFKKIKNKKKSEFFKNYIKSKNEVKNFYIKEYQFD